MRERLRGERGEHPLEPLGAEVGTTTLDGSRPLIRRARASTTIEPPRRARPAASSARSATGASSGPATAVTARSRATCRGRARRGRASAARKAKSRSRGEPVEQRLPHPERILLDEQVAHALDPQAGALEQRARPAGVKWVRWRGTS